MKKAGYIFILSIFLFANVLYSLFMIVEQEWRHEFVQERILSGDEPAERTILKLTAEQYSKLIRMEDNEIEYKGEVYDVERTETSLTGSVIIYCFKDEIEKEVLMALDNSVKANNDISSTAGKSTKSLTKTLIEDLFYYSSDLYSVSPFSIVLFSSIPDGVVCRPLQVSTPPPQYSLLFV